MLRILTRRRRRLTVLLCVILLFCTVFSTTAFADSVTVTTSPSTSYFQTFSSKGVWTGIGTPKHYITETGQVVYCVQTSKTEPTNAPYTSVNGESVFSTYAVRRGIELIIQNGYPTTNGGFSDDEARYATANAIRFFLVDCGEPNVPAWMNLNLYSQFFRAASGYEALWNWCMSLRSIANNQASYSGTSHSINFSTQDLTLTEDGEYFVGQSTVTLSGCEGGYRLETYSLPAGSILSGYTGNSGDVLTVYVPTTYENGWYTLYATGIGYQNQGSLEFYSPSYNSSLQTVVTYVGAGSTLGETVYSYMTVTTPTASVKTGDLVITKYGAETGQTLSDAGFKLFNSSGMEIASGYTDGRGQVSFTELPLGTYSYTEYDPPDGYTVDSTVYQITIDSGGEVVQQRRENSQIKGSIMVHKQDASGTALAGSGFLLESTTDGSTWSAVQQLTSDNTGAVCFSSLAVSPDMTYRITEISSNAGYSLQAEPVFCGTLSQDADYDISLTVCNCPNITMPFTGGEGFNHICYLALMLIGMSFFAVQTNMKKKENLL